MNDYKLLIPAMTLSFAACSLGIKAPASGPAKQTATLRRAYTGAEVMKYKLTLDYSQTGQPDYTAVSTAEATVKKGEDGVFYESWQWIGARKKDADVKLSPESLGVRQLLSLDPSFRLAVPDLSKAFALSEPITDALTFYADVQLAIRKNMPLKAGEHVYVPHGLPSSWAGGPTTLGRDCIDFDLTLSSVNEAENTATLDALHLPPPQGCGEPPAAWMIVPVSDTANNWYQVQKQGKSFVAGAAKETFEDEIKLSLSDGRILAATQLNRLEGAQRTCRNVHLAKCGAPEKFAITRKLVLSQGD